MLGLLPCLWSMIQEHRCHGLGTSWTLESQHILAPFWKLFVSHYFFSQVRYIDEGIAYYWPLKIHFSAVQPLSLPAECLNKYVIFFPQGGASTVFEYNLWLSVWCGHSSTWLAETSTWEHVRAGLKFCNDVSCWLCQERLLIVYFLISFYRGLKTLVSRGRFQNTVSMDPGTRLGNTLLFTAYWSSAKPKILKLFHPFLRCVHGRRQFTSKDSGVDPQTVR